MRRHVSTMTSLALAATLLACGRSAARDTAADSAFADVQRRGATVMGVDQSTSSHVFEDLPDGGRIILDRQDPSDTAGVRVIRAHMRDIAGAFARGDFSAPGMVHDRDVPGTAVMASHRDAITYTPIERPAGAEVRITSADTAAIGAIHDFLAFQRAEHRAAGHEHSHHMMDTASARP